MNEKEESRMVPKLGIKLYLWEFHQNDAKRLEMIKISHYHSNHHIQTI